MLFAFRYKVSSRCFVSLTYTVLPTKTLVSTTTKQAPDLFLTGHRHTNTWEHFLPLTSLLFSNLQG